SSGWPVELSTCWTMGGTLEGLACLAALRCKASRFCRQAAHSPPGPGVPPQAHLRCSKSGYLGLTGVDETVICACVLPMLDSYLSCLCASGFAGQIPWIFAR